MSSKAKCGCTGGNYSFYHADALIRGPITDNVRYLLGGVQREARRRLHQEPRSGRRRRHQRSLDGRGAARSGSRRERRGARALFEVRVERHVRRRQHAAVDDLAVRHDLCRTTAVSTTTPTFGFTGQNPAVDDPYTADTNRTVVGTLEDHNRIHLDFTWDLGGATLKYFGGYQEYLYHTGSDSDDTPRTGVINIPVPAGGTTRSGRFRGTAMRFDFDGAGPVAPLRDHSPGLHGDERHGRSRRLVRGIAALVVERDQRVLERRRRAAVDRRSVSVRHDLGQPAAHQGARRCGHSRAHRPARGLQPARHERRDQRSPRRRVLRGVRSDRLDVRRRLDVHARRALHGGQEEGLRRGLLHRTHPVHCDRRGGSEPSRARYGSSSHEPGAGGLCRPGDCG